MKRTQQQKDYYQENKAKISATYKKWYYDNHDAVKVLRKNAVDRNSQSYKQARVRYLSSLKGRFYKTSASARKRGIGLHITQEQFEEIVKNPCAYCGEDNKVRGIDRIDNNLGYLPDNCASCCVICNIMKRAMSVDDFLSHLHKIVAHTSQ